VLPCFLEDSRVKATPLLQGKERLEERTRHLRDTEGFPGGRRK